MGRNAAFVRFAVLEYSALPHYVEAEFEWDQFS